MSKEGCGMVPIGEQLRCVERELGMRRKAYPRWVADGRMTQAKADCEIRAMEAVAKTLREIDVAGRLL